MVALVTLSTGWGIANYWFYRSRAGVDETLYNERFHNYIAELGITRADRVFVHRDKTPNATLAATNLLGYSTFNYDYGVPLPWNQEPSIPVLQANDVKYVFLLTPDAGPSAFQQSLEPYLEGGFEGISIFKLPQP